MRLAPVLLVLLLSAPLAAPLSARAEALAGPVPATLLRVVDGDTLELRVRVWLDQDLVVKARLDGVDAPEITRPACAAERALGVEARELIARELAAESMGEAAGDLTLTDIRHDKYAGRVVARVRDARGRDLSDLLLGSGLADIYGEGRDWCAG